MAVELDSKSEAKQTQDTARGLTSSQAIWDVSRNNLY